MAKVTFGGAGFGKCAGLRSVPTNSLVPAKGGGSDEARSRIHVPRYLIRGGWFGRNWLESNNMKLRPY